MVVGGVEWGPCTTTMCTPRWGAVAAAKPPVQAAVGKTTPGWAVIMGVMAARLERDARGEVWRLFSLC